MLLLTVSALTSPFTPLTACRPRRADFGARPEGQTMSKSIQARDPRPRGSTRMSMRPLPASCIASTTLSSRWRAPCVGASLRLLDRFHFHLGAAARGDHHVAGDVVEQQAAGLADGEGFVDTFAFDLDPSRAGGRAGRGRVPAVRASPSTARAGARAVRVLLALRSSCSRCCSRWRRLVLCASPFPFVFLALSPTAARSAAGAVVRSVATPSRAVVAGERRRRSCRCADQPACQPPVTRVSKSSSCPMSFRLSATRAAQA